MFCGGDGRVAVSQDGGGDEYCRAWRKLDRQTQVPKNKVTAFGMVVRAQAGHCTPPPAQVHHVLVRLCVGVRTDVERDCCKRVVLIGVLEPGNGILGICQGVDREGSKIRGKRLH